MHSNKPTLKSAMIAMDSSKVVERLREKYADQKIVFVSGNFNIIHPGHLRLLNFARTCGDRLVVALYADPEPGVLVPFSLRRESVSGLAAVDDVMEVAYDQLFSLITLLQPYAVVKGKEHDGNFNLERDAVRAYGGHLIFSSGEAKFSSLDLIRNEVLTPADFVIRQEPNFLDRHGSSRDQLKSIISSFDKLRVLVIGDLIIDEYVYCDPLGMSQEDPTIVVTPVDSTTYVGGAGIVAAHVAGLGANSTFISVVGSDATADRSEAELAKFGVNTVLIKDSSRPTILKQRFRASNKTLLRVSHLRAHDIGEEFVEQVMAAITRVISEIDLVIFSDFNYGCLPQILVDKVYSLCNEKGIPFAADSQASSQVGDVSRYRGAALLSATEREVRLALNDFKSGLQNVADRLLQKTDAKMLMVKLGAEGLLVLSNQTAPRTDSLRAMNANPVDVAGAGDALLAASSLTLATGASIWESAYLGSLSAGIQVSRVGNIPIELRSLLAELERR
jgi:rfaE bifunctional protein kinase chain/domain